MNQVVNTPNNEVMTSSFMGQIPVSSVLSKKERYENVFKDIHSASLISFGKLCYGGCNDILDKNKSMLSKVLS